MPPSFAQRRRGRRCSEAPYLCGGENDGTGNEARADPPRQLPASARGRCRGSARCDQERYARARAAAHGNPACRRTRRQPHARARGDPKAGAGRLRRHDAAARHLRREPFHPRRQRCLRDSHGARFARLRPRGGAHHGERAGKPAASPRRHRRTYRGGRHGKDRGNGHALSRPPLSGEPQHASRRHHLEPARAAHALSFRLDVVSGSSQGDA